MKEHLNRFLQLIALATAMIITSRSYAQLPVNDTIKAFLKQIKQDTQSVRLLNQQSELVSDKNANQSLILAQEALQLAEKLKFNQGYGRALNNISWAHYRKSDYAKSFEFSTRALKWNDSINHLPQLGISYKNIGAVYFSQANYKKAIEFFKKGLELHIQLNDSFNIGRALNNLAFNSIRAGLLNDAKSYGRKALAHNRAIKDDNLIAFSYRSMGDIAETEHKIDSAIYYYKLAVVYADKAQTAFTKETALYRLGRLYTTKKEYKKALSYLDEALEVAMTLGAKSETAMIYKLKANAFKGLKDYENAFIAQQKYSVLNDSIYQDKSRSKLAELQAQFGAERKQVEINALIKEREQRIERVKQQTILNISLGITVLVSAIMLFVIWRRNKYKQLTNRILMEQKKSLEETSVLKDKIFSIISHDLRSPIGSLSAVLPLLEPDSLDYDTYQTLKNSLIKQVKSLNITLDNLLVWARTQMKGSATPIKADFNVHQLVENNITLLHGMADQKKISLLNKVPDNCTAFADKQQIDIIIRNFLLNALKFTHDHGTVSIDTTESSDKIILTVSDTGIGMTQEQIGKLFQLKTHFTTPGTHKEKGTGLGLLVCAEYAAANNCTLKVESEVNKGTIISLILPKQSS